MKLLLDECVPKGLRRHLRGHNAITVAKAGWNGIENGTLLRLAAADGFQAFITTDRGYEFQQNVSTLTIPVVILLSRSNALPDVLPLLPRLLSALMSLRGGITKIDY